MFNAVSLPVGSEKDTTNNDACTPNPPFVDVTKRAMQVTGPVDGVYSAVYRVQVSNLGGTADTYGPLVDAPSFAPGTTVLGASWTFMSQAAGQAPTVPTSPTTVTGTGPFTLAPATQTIAGRTTHTYEVTVRFTISGAVSAATCTSSPGSGLFNSVTITGEDGPTTDNSACLPMPELPKFAVKKAADAPPPGGPVYGETGPNVTAIYDTATNSFIASVTYLVTVTNTGALAGPAPAVTDTMTLPTGFTITKLNVEGASQTVPVPASRTATFTIPAGTTTLQPGESVTHKVVVTAAGNPSQSQWSNAAQCTTKDAGAATGGFFNLVTISGDTDGATNNDACVPVYEPKKVIGLQKYGSPCDAATLECRIIGAQFDIYAVDPATNPTATPVDSMTADPSAPVGVTDWVAGSTYTSGNLHYGWDYWLVERKASDGYELLADPVMFKIVGNGITLTSAPGTDNGSVITVIGDRFSLKVVNTQAAELPQAGGEGPLPYAALGLLLIGAGFVLSRRSGGPKTPGAPALT